MIEHRIGHQWSEVEPNRKLQLLAEIEQAWNIGTITVLEKNYLQKVVREYSVKRAVEIIAQERKNRT